MSADGPLSAALWVAAQAPALLVATDFDGTLARYALDPGQATPVPGALRALAGLAMLPRTHVHVISGRGRDDLAARLSPGLSPAVTLWGSYGAEGPGLDPSLHPGDPLALREAWIRLRGVARSVPGVRVEVKPLAVALHTRGMPAHAAAAAEALARRIIGRTPLLEIPGAHVLEWSSTPPAKAQVLRHVRPQGGPAIYFGDDVSDEPVFASMGPQDVPVKVGPGPSAARHRIDTPEQAAELLGLLHDLRSRACR